MPRVPPVINTYPLWKNLLVAAVIAIGFFYALPNLFGEDPAVQIAGSGGRELDEQTVERLRAHLDERQLPGRYELEDGQLLIRFDTTQQQLLARDSAARLLGEDYVCALNLAPATPQWMRELGMQPLKLGLDLRGGVHFLMEIDMDAALSRLKTQLVSDFRAALREADIRLSGARVEGDSVVVTFRDAEAAERGFALLRREQRGLVFTQGEHEGRPVVRAQLTEERLRELRTAAVEQNITIIRNRVNELGVAEPLVQRQGAERVVVELPGIQDTARAKEILGATATLEFRLADNQTDMQAVLSGRIPAGLELLHDRSGYPVVVERRVVLTGDHIVDASSSSDENGRPQVNISLDARGGSLMSDFTRDHVGRQMATNFIEYKPAAEPQDRPAETREQAAQTREQAAGTQPDGARPRLRRVEQVINVATIQSRFGANFRITGLDSPREAHNLALLLRAGALIAPVQIVEERTIGPSLGQQNIDRGLRAMLYGFAVLVLFMVLYYKAFGLVADLALIFNLVLIVGVMSMVPGATMTMPGIAGVVLTMGMATDANVLIYERIREELRAGRPVQQAIHLGYERAFSTIADANITTFITALILFLVGTGTIKGFALVLMIGIASSMFTAVTACRAVVNLIWGGRERLAGLPI